MFHLSDPYSILPASIWWFFNISVAVLLLGLALLPSTRRALVQPQRLSIFLALTLFLMLIWLIKAQVLGGFYLHLIGASVAYLLLGTRIAVLALAVVLTLTNLTVHDHFLTWGLQFLLVVLLPILLASALHTVAKRMLPRRLFVFIIVRGFFVAMLSMTLTSLLNLLILNELLVASIDNIGDSTQIVLPILLGWGEGMLSGMACALIGVYRPEWWFVDEVFVDV